jgi:hypothetical protein
LIECFIDAVDNTKIHIQTKSPDERAGKLKTCPFNYPPQKHPGTDVSNLKYIMRLLPNNEPEMKYLKRI